MASLQKFNVQVNSSKAQEDLSKLQDKLNEMKLVSESIGSAAFKLGKVYKYVTGSKSLDIPKPGLDEQIDEALDFLMDNPDKVPVAVQASKKAPKFFGTKKSVTAKTQPQEAVDLGTKTSIVPGSLVITSGGEVMSVDSINYGTGELTVSLTPNAGNLVEVCSELLPYDPALGDSWLHPDIEVQYEIKSLRYLAYCPHCNGEWWFNREKVPNHGLHHVSGQPSREEDIAQLILKGKHKPCNLP